MSDLDMWSALVGAVLPPGIAIINQSHWSRAWRFIVTILCGLVAAAVTCWLMGLLDGHDYFHSALVVLFATLVAYHTGWKPSTIASAIEAATSK